MQSLTAKAAITEMLCSDWGIEQWFAEQHSRSTRVPGRLGATQKALPVTFQPGPLRESMIQEFSWKSISELEAAKGLLRLTEIAPALAEFDYFCTQILDEARHARMFRDHLVDIGFGSGSDIMEKMYRCIGDADERIIVPLRDYFDKWVVERKNFFAGVSIITIVLEGVLAPSAEMGELKWRPFDTAGADLQAAANADELRHLCVCAGLVKNAATLDQRIREQVQECIDEGMKLWASVPWADMVLKREQLYQEGMNLLKGSVEGYQIAPGMLLSESTPESRLELALTWTHEMQTSHLEYMSLL